MKANDHYRRAENLLNPNRIETIDEAKVSVLKGIGHALLAVAATHGADEPGLMDALRRMTETIDRDPDGA